MRVFFNNEGEYLFAHEGLIAETEDWTLEDWELMESADPDERLSVAVGIAKKVENSILYVDYFGDNE